MIYLLEDVNLSYPRLRENKEIINLLNGQNSKLICCGHSHIPRSVQINQKQLIVNPGSIGLQAYTDNEPVKHSMQNYSPLASYCIIEKNDSSWIVNNIKVPYDIKSAVKECKKNNAHDWAHFLQIGRKV